MRRVIKDAWIDALRSGDYQQGKGSLRSRENEYCCLGVLCDVVRPLDWADNDAWGVMGHPLAQTNAKMLNINALREFGLTNEQQQVLAEWNDEGKDFSAIARFIDAFVVVD